MSPVEKLLDQTQQLMDEWRIDEAVAVLAAATEPSAAVSARRAVLEEKRDRPAAALAYWAEAQRLDPGDLAHVVGRARLLRMLERPGEVLALVDALPAADQEVPEIRAILGDLYQWMGLPSLAMEAYGEQGVRQLRRAAWWRSGGPLRRWTRAFERSCLTSWRQDCAYNLRGIAAIPWSPHVDVAGIRAEIETDLLYPAVLWERLNSVRLAARRFVLIGGSVAGWVVLAGIGALRWGLSAWAATLLAAVCVAVGYQLRRAVFGRFASAVPWSTAALRAVALVLLLLIGGAALTQVGWPNEVVPEVGAALLIAPVALGLPFLVVFGPINLWAVLTRRNHWRARPRTDILDELFAVLDELSDPIMRNDLWRRSWWMSRLERAATSLEKRLPAILYPIDQATTEWSSARAKGAAAALRKLKQLVAAPTHGSWERLELELRHAVVAIATGDFGRLRWAPPPSPTMVRRSRIRTASGVLKTLALAVVPLVAALVLEPWLSLDSKTAQWARLAGFGWAVLYVLLAADPGLREKIDTAQRAASVLKGNRSAGSENEP